MPTIIKNQWGRRANAADIRVMLGLKPNGHLPTNGIDDQVIQGVRIRVWPQMPKAPGQRKRSWHRIVALCDCGRHIPVGRVHQHKCKTETTERKRRLAESGDIDAHLTARE